MAKIANIQNQETLTAENSATTIGALPMNLLAALAAQAAFINATHPLMGLETQDFDGVKLENFTFNSHQDFAGKFFGIHDALGNIRKAVSTRSDTAKEKISQFRFSRVTLTDGSTIEKVGISIKSFKDDALVQTPVEVPMLKAFFSITEPAYLATAADKNAVNQNYAALPKVPTIEDLLPTYPKLETLAVEGVELVIKAKNLVHAVIKTHEGLEAFFIEASKLLPADTVRLSSQTVYFREAGSADAYSSMPKATFAKLIVADLTGWDVYVSVNLVTPA